MPNQKHQEALQRSAARRQRENDASRLKDGQRLKVSYYHAITIYDGQVSASLVDPKIFALHQDQLQRVNRLLAPPGFFFSHDELRCANWSAVSMTSCQVRLVASGSAAAR